jgi:TonB family protein
MNQIAETPKKNLLTSSVVSTGLHALFFSLFFISTQNVPKFEGYPTLLPVELVSFGPVSFNAQQTEGSLPQSAVETSETAPETVTETPAPEPVEETEPENSPGITVESTEKKEEPKEQKPAGNTDIKIKEPKDEPKIEEAPAQESAGTNIGSGGEGMRLDVREFPFSYYLAALRTRIQSNWFPPYQGARSAISRKAIVYFRIERNGEINNVAVEKSSGDLVFDRAAQAAVMQASPLPPLPFDFPERALGVHFEFEQGR